jgi:SAM-dependent methyltransferase
MINYGYSSDRQQARWWENMEGYSFPVRMIHRLLNSSFCYSCLQISVGAEGFRNRFLQDLLRCEPRGAQVLDLGCGPGANRKVINPDFSYVGVDLSDKYIAKAISKNKSSLNTAFICADLVTNDNWLQHIDIKGRNISLAFALWHHLSDEQLSNILTKLRSKFTSEAALVSIDPIITDDSTKFAIWLAKNDRGPYLRSQKDFEKIYSENGFSTEIEIHRNQMRIPGNIISIEAKLK